PGYAETRGNSVLINGLPIDGNVVAGSNTVEFGVAGLNAFPGAATLSPGKRVRVTGLITSDPDHVDDPDPGLRVHRAEIHPVYAIDLVQDFTQPRLSVAGLTGAWHANDVGTYYLRQTDEKTLWWL